MATELDQRNIPSTFKWQESRSHAPAFPELIPFNNEIRMQKEKKHITPQTNNSNEKKPMKTSWIYRIIKISMALTILIIAAGIIVLQISHSSLIEIPVIFTVLGSAAVGVLAGLIILSPDNNFKS